MRKDFVEVKTGIQIFGVVKRKNNDAKCIKTIEILMLLKFRLWIFIY